MLEKTFIPSDVEKLSQKRWEEYEKNHKNQKNKQGVPYTIMMPPPNITGVLHMGHALSYTLQDILIRYAKMQGKDTLWQPGIDHAGIATQLIVQQQLEKQGLTKEQLGREKFLEKVWSWKEESGGAIIDQLKRLGSSANWEYERFTMDEGLSKAVRKVFVRLYKEKIIYKDKRLVNWDTKIQTAVSDLEVVTKEVQGQLVYIQYQVESGGSITVATTRPETFFADSAIAVHPHDERYKKLIGQYVILPITGKKIPIIADAYADQEKGSGAVKITPAHDFNDFEVGKRHSLPQDNILEKNGTLNDKVPKAYRGLSVAKAREKVISDLEELGVIEKIEPSIIMMPISDRTQAVIEPLLTDQWFLDAQVLAKPAMEAVKNGKTTFVPPHWENTYFEWLENIRPWCISRQLWWGHQIPAWYTPDGHIVVEETEEMACHEARKIYGQDISLTQDEDVLDTWFSSGLWSFSTLGWPEKTERLERYYPTDTLVTAFDIIFFWVARMMMLSLHIMKDVPFKTVYIHALVRDAKGQKMSKSKGNVINPLDSMEKYGADALRFALASMAGHSRDINLSDKSIEGYRNYITKIYNSIRFAGMHACKIGQDYDPKAVKMALNASVLHRLYCMQESMTKALDAYKFNDAAREVYQFFWGDVCDWYIEMSKPIVENKAGTSEEKEETKSTLMYVIQTTLKVLHPFMPFVTEHLWHHINDQKQTQQQSILVYQPWASEGKRYKKEEENIKMIEQLITTIRSLRATMNIPASAKIQCHMGINTGEQADYIKVYQPQLIQLGRLSSITVGNEEKKGKGIVQIPFVSEKGVAIQILLHVGDAIDISAVKQKLEKELSSTETERQTIEKRLSNSGFIEKAPAEKIADDKNTQFVLKEKEAMLRGIVEQL